jgi:uncharacterized membrane protein YphA (DoxX/SURF4 family)
MPMMGAIPHSLGLEVRVALVCVGIFLLGGLWTPLMGSAAALIELLITFSHMVDNAAHIVLAILGMSLALLGPGAWSIDARIFGRKRIDIDVG